MGTKTALVTGGAGFLGSHICYSLLEDGWRILVADNMSTGKASNLPNNVDIENIDISSSKISGLIKKFNPNSIFHTAAQISVPTSTRKPVFDAQVNINATIRILETFRQNGNPLKSFLFLSTGGGIYGQVDKLPASENVKAQPLAPYGISKLAAEIYVQYFRKAYGLKTSIVRPSNIYGPRQNPDSEAGVIAIFIKSMLAKQKVNIFGDGDDQRDYIYVSDVVKGCRLAEKYSLNQPLNLGTGLSTSVNDLFQIISKLCNYNLQPNYCDRRPGDVTNITLDSNEAKRLLGWDIKINLEEGLRKTVESFKNDKKKNSVKNNR